ncbi:MAG: alpha/beta hydrolase [Planctomycetota bacterium]|jgi:fermentation-respiration switch protein FrsA (DUF1100 family)
MARGDRFFYHPTTTTVYDRPEEHGLCYESVSFDSRDGTGLQGWFLPAVGQAHGTVVHCHGNAGNITGHYRFVAWLPKRGFNVLCFDYRGYGRSEGQPTREGTVLDTHAAIDYVTTRSEVDPGRVVLFGQSLGGTVAVVVATQRDDLAGLAIEGAFAAYQGEAHFVCRQTWWLWGLAGVISRFFVAPGLDAITCVDRIGAIPKLFICGTADTIVPYRQTVALYKSAAEPKDLWVVEGGGHAEALIDEQIDGQDPAMNRRDRFRAFLQRSVDGSAG